MAITLAATVRVEITCADKEGLLARLSAEGIVFYHVQHTDTLTVNLEISRHDLNVVTAFTRKHGASIKITGKKGIYWDIIKVKKRPVLAAGLCLILALVFWLPTRVLFITVEGNETIPDKHIIEQADLCGISFGASRREVRSEKMKNSLLFAIPSLQWAGINTNGCTAVISVRERTQFESKKEGSQVSSIIAVRDGVIESCTAEKGNLLCRTGQVVKQGDVLISGYTDCGLTITATRAEGEVFAKTMHELTVVTPTEYTQKGETVRTEKKYGIIIGKKRINFYKGSGISGAGCDKIYEEYYVTLPGGFRLPIVLFVCVTNVHDQIVVSAGTELAESTAGAYARQYLLSQMISGRILHDTAQIQQHDGVCVLLGRYICNEMIGRVHSEEIIKNYGENN